MTANKMTPTNASVEQHIGAIARSEQREDCYALADLMSKLTHERPKMWGASIVGFGAYRYKYESGRTGEAALAGFAARGGEIVVYLPAPGAKQDALLRKLGPHKLGKCCLYIRRLREVDTKVLAQLIVESMAEVKRRYGSLNGHRASSAPTAEDAAT